MHQCPSCLALRPDTDWARRLVVSGKGQGVTATRHGSRQPRGHRSDHRARLSLQTRHAGYSLRHRLTIEAMTITSRNRISAGIARPWPVTISRKDTTALAPDATSHTRSKGPVGHTIGYSIGVETPNLKTTCDDLSGSVRRSTVVIVLLLGLAGNSFTEGRCVPIVSA